VHRPSKSGFLTEVVGSSPTGGTIVCNANGPAFDLRRLDEYVNERRDTAE